MTIRPQILQNRSNLVKLREEIEPINGFERPMDIIDTVGANPINDIMSCIKSAALPLEEIADLRKPIRGPFGNSEIPLPEFCQIRSALITKFHLYEIMPLSKRVDPIGRQRAALIATPVDLSQLEFPESLAFWHQLGARRELRYFTAILKMLAMGKSDGAE